MWQALLQLELSGRGFDCSKGAGLRALGLVEGACSCYVHRKGGMLPYIHFLHCTGCEIQHRCQASCNTISVLTHHKLLVAVHHPAAAVLLLVLAFAR
jgi:hypothetical protein